MHYGRCLVGTFRFGKSRIAERTFLADKIMEGTHVFDVLKMTHETSTYFLPVITINEEYIGIITSAEAPS